MDTTTPQTITADPEVVEWATGRVLETYTPVNFIDGPKPQLDKLASLDQTAAALIVAILLRELVVTTGGGPLHLPMGTVLIYLEDHHTSVYGAETVDEKNRYARAGLKLLEETGFVEFYNEDATVLLRQWLAWHAVELLGAHLARQVLGTAS